MRRRCWSRRQGRWVTCTRAKCPPGHGSCWSLRLDRFVICRADHEAPRKLGYGAFLNGPVSYGAFFHNSGQRPPKPEPTPWDDHVWLSEPPEPAQLARIRQERAAHPFSWMLTAREVLGC